MNGLQCTWGPGTTRTTMTRHHEQSLRNRIKTLDSYIEVLQAKLRERGQDIPSFSSAGSASGSPAPSTSSAATPGSPLVAREREGSEWREDVSVGAASASASDDMSGVVSPTTFSATEDTLVELNEGDADGEGDPLSETEVDKLCIPTENLFVSFVVL